MLENQETPTRIDPRTKRTNQLLLNAFGELLADKSFEAITVQDIAERATVNRATFYAHFQDKYILLEAFTAEMIQKALRQKLPPGSAYSEANLQLLVETICEFLAQLRSHCAPSNRNQFGSLVERQVKQEIYLILLRWLEPPTSRPAMRREQAELQATMSSWAIYGAAKRWSEGEHKESAAQFAHRTLPLIAAGLEARTAEPARFKIQHVHARN